MKELPSFGGHLRALFAFDPKRQAIVLLGGDNAPEHLAHREGGRGAARPPLSSGRFTASLTSNPPTARATQVFEAERTHICAPRSPSLH